MTTTAMIICFIMAAQVPESFCVDKQPGVATLSHAQRVEFVEAHNRLRVSVKPSAANMLRMVVFVVDI